MRLGGAHHMNKFPTKPKRRKRPLHPWEHINFWNGFFFIFADASWSAIICKLHESPARDLFCVSLDWNLYLCPRFYFVHATCHLDWHLVGIRKVIAGNWSEWWMLNNDCYQVIHVISNKEWRKEEKKHFLIKWNLCCALMSWTRSSHCNRERKVKQETLSVRA